MPKDWLDIIRPRCLILKFCTRLFNDVTIVLPGKARVGEMYLYRGRYCIDSHFMHYQYIFARGLIHVGTL